jgi:hypothetical protein
MRVPQFAVDWDGTCTEDSWPTMGDWRPGAIEGLHRLTQLGRVVIHTCRIAPVEVDGYTPRPAHLVQMEKDDIRAMLTAAGLHNVEIHDKPWKPSADEYIDNKARRIPARVNAWDKLADTLEALYGKEDASTKR